MNDPTELGYERIARFLAIRRAGLIGPLWIRNGRFAVAEHNSPHESDAVDASVSTVIRRIDYWYPGFGTEIPPRKPPLTFTLPARGVQQWNCKR